MTVEHTRTSASMSSNGIRQNRRCEISFLYAAAILPLATRNNLTVVAVYLGYTHISSYILYCNLDYYN